MPCPSGLPGVTNKTNGTLCDSLFILLLNIYVKTRKYWFVNVILYNLYFITCISVCVRLYLDSFDKSDVMHGPHKVFRAVNPESEVGPHFSWWNSLHMCAQAHVSGASPHVVMSCWY